MKKPKLTKGEWKVTHNNLGEVGISANGKRVVVEVEPNQEELANAKAISAVPDMLDECMKYRRVLNTLLTDPTYCDDPVSKGYLEKRKSELEQALKKAGCQ